MNRLSILLLLYLLSVDGTNASIVEPSDVLFEPSATSSYGLDISNDATNLQTLSKLPQSNHFGSDSDNDAVPPTLWIVGLGLCLVFIGYKMKNKTE
jgi:hypothetical protein